ncbi:hypothetical protein A2U01_0051393 [Trifolium medium]|uniref:Uncharacterized protein n=1 Tax=Trifolium medium TaxID=97028 RepID=A0A392R244_9FABA|nr:hypothetical protein [Trifolium medium]
MLYSAYFSPEFAGRCSCESLARSRRGCQPARNFLPFFRQLSPGFAGARSVVPSLFV